MSYTVILTPEAEAKIRTQAAYIAEEEQQPLTAARWLQKVLKASDTLSEFPHRCPFARENDFRPYEIRMLVVGSFLLIFTVVEETKTVWIVNARHGRQLPQSKNLPIDKD